MMNVAFKSMICATSVVLSAGLAAAQTTPNSPSTSSGGSGYSTTSDKSGVTQGTQTQQFFQAKNLIGEKVKNAQDQSLGSIKDIVFSPQSGETFAAIDVGSSRYALVPWQALTITAKGSRGKEQVSLNTTKEDLKSAPTIPEDQWEQLNNRSFVQSIYSHYNLQAPSMGGSLGTGTSGSSTGTSSDTGTSSSSSQGTAKPQH